MRRFGVIVAVLAALGVAPVLAQQAQLRPEARPVPDAPMRPTARPVLPVAEPARPDALPEAAPLGTQPVAAAIPLVPAVTSAPLRPVARAGVAEALPADGGDVAVQRISTRSAPLTGPLLLRRADLLMQPPAVRLLDDWRGRVAPVRPDYMAIAAIQPMVRAPLRPSGRPHQPWMDAIQNPDDLPLEEGDAGDPGFTLLAVSLALRPPERPAGIEAEALRVRAERQRGSLCGAIGLQGDRLGSVPGRGACGVSDAVRVRTVAGVRLSTPATMTCTTARALLRWVENGAIPAVGNAGGGLASMRVVSHYSCRTRNSQPGARLSEHAFGKAIDIAGFGLRDGSEITVLRGWNSHHGERLRRMWRAACGPFGTVLGPNANRFHADHFHFDTASYRSGSYCR